MKKTKQSRALSARDKWQDRAGVDAARSEVVFLEVMRDVVLPEFGNYLLVEKPGDMNKIYGKRGITPDFSIANPETGRKIFVEVKRQGPEGNAHERAGKYFAPGIVKEARRIGNLSAGEFPFFMVFTGNLATDERYRPEITKWFNKELAAHFLLWKNWDPKILRKFFAKNMRPVLDRRNP